VVDLALAPALEEGLLVAEPGAHPAVRFRHDRIREAVLGRLEPQRRRALQLAMARRLAAVPELFAVAAEQYLPAVGMVADAAERRQVAGLLRRAAGQATLIGDYALVHTLLTAALPAVDPGETATLAEVHAGRHAALYSLGRLEEADEVYRTIERLCPTVVDRADATAVQVHSVTHRNRFAEALGLGLESLRELGVAVPAADRLAAELDHQFGYWYQWLDHTDAAGDLARPDLTDPVLLAVSGLINATQPAAFFLGDPAMVTWLGVEALRICLEHGPAPALVVPVAYTAFGAVALRGDYAAGYRAARRILALAEARGYEPGTSQARMQFAALSFWAEPIENSVHAAQRAREGLIAGGDSANAGYAYYVSVSGLLDCAPLERYLTEAEAALAFSRRTGKTGRVLDSYWWLTDVLRDESTAAAGEAVSTDKYAGDPHAQFFAHLSQATAAAVFGDPAGLERHTAAAMLLVPVLPGLYPTGVARLLRGLAVAGQARDADAGTRGGLLSELDELTRWLAARAADGPDNFLHLLRLLEAERAWAAGDFRAAALAFDAARQEAAQRQRPWHRALIAEHAARFYLAHGLEHAGHDLLAQARQEYLAWGATAKVAQLDWAYPARRPPSGAIAGEQSGDLTHRRAAVTAGTVDLLGIVAASQALSSETSIDRLHARVVQVLSAMTGATAVHLLLWDSGRQDWLLPAPGGTVQASDGGQEGAAPMSVLRYVQRTSEPLAVGDATRDDRFARDPYFAGVDCCSLLAVPILSRDALRAVLLLENRLIRGAFTTGRLDAVNLIAGQLAVSLDNAQLYAGYRRLAEEQAALRRVATLVAAGAPPGEAFAAVAEEAGRLFLVDAANMCRYESDGTATIVASAGGRFAVGSRLRLEGKNSTTLVYQTGRAARVESYADISGPIGVTAREGGVRSSVATPVMVEGRLWGALGVGARTEQLLPPDAEARLASFAELAATAIANAESRTALTRLAEEQAALRRVATLVARGAAADELFAAVTGEVGRLLGAHLAGMGRYGSDDTVRVVAAWGAEGVEHPMDPGPWPLDGGDLASIVFRTGQSVRTDDYDGVPGPIGKFVREELGVDASVASPIVVEGRLWGVLFLHAKQGRRPFPRDAESRLTGFTELVATAIANAESRAALAASRARIVTAADEARRRIERDLHDGTQQQLVSLMLDLRAVQAAVPPQLAQLEGGLSGIAERIEGVFDQVREISHGIHPAILSERGLQAALRALARRSAVPVELDLRVGRRLPDQVEVAAYYAVSEALANAAKHAQASGRRHAQSDQPGRQRHHPAHRNARLTSAKPGG